MRHRFTNTLLAGIASVALLAFATSCEDDNGKKPSPNPTPDPSTVHYDVWVPLKKATGMQDESYVVHRATDLTKGTLSVKGSGVDLTGQMTPETVIRGKYYYQINKSKRFIKAVITESGIQILKEIPSEYFTPGKYSHAWLDDKTLLLIGAQGDSKAVLWVKYDVEKMAEIAHGKLELPEPPKGSVYTSSGLLGYRHQDKMLIYSFSYKIKGTKKDRQKEFYVAFLDPATLKTMKVVTEDRAEQMAGTAFGELRQNKTFFDERGNYYIACNSLLPGEKNGKGKETTTAQRGALLRINAGEMDFDKSFNGYTKNSRGEERGKFITVDYLGQDKVLCYMQDPKFARPDEEPIWDTSSEKKWVFYWIILDLKTGAQTHLKDIPFSNGNFNQLALVNGDIIYIANNSAKENSCIYVYNRKTGKLEKGLTFEDKGMTIDRITQMAN